MTAHVRDLVARRQPLYEFVIRGLLAEHDLDTPEGQVEALRRAVPVVAQIKDNALRKGYATKLAGWVGWDDIQLVVRRVGDQARRARSGKAVPARETASEAKGSEGAQGNAAAAARPHPSDPVLLPQRQVLAAVLQYPATAGPLFDSLEPEAFTHPAFTAVHAAVVAAGGTAAGLGGAEWVSLVADHTDDLMLRALVSELATESLPVKSMDGIPRFIAGVLARVQEAWVGRQVAALKSKLQRVSSTEQPDDYMALFGDLVALEQYRKSLLTQAMGNSDDFAPIR